MTSKEDDQFDAVFLGLAQQISRAKGGGIDPLLNTFFGFLRRKTDFFKGAGEEKVKETINKLLDHQFILFSNDTKKEQAEIAKRRAKAAEKAEKAEEPDIVEIPSDEDEEDEEEGAKENTDKSNEVDSDVDEEEKNKIKPNLGNGGDYKSYYWTQTLEEVTVNVYINASLRSKDLDIKITKTKLKIGVKNCEPILNGTLFADIKVDEATWTLEDIGGYENSEHKSSKKKKERLIAVYFQKQKGMCWWNSVIKGEREINTKKVEPENSKLSDLDGETRQTVEKMMYDQKQKKLGLPTSEERNKQEMMNKFMKAHPEMDFSKAKFS